MALRTGVVGSPRSGLSTLVLGAPLTSTTFSRTVVETVTSASDSVVRSFTGARNITESYSTTDTPTRSFTGSRGVIESIRAATDVLVVPGPPSSFLATKALPLYALLFDKGMNFQGTLGNVLNRPMMKSTLNSGMQPIALQLAVASSLVQTGQIVQVYEQGGDGTCIYQGIVADTPDALSTQTQHSINLDPMITELGMRQFSATYTATDVAQMVRDVAGLGAHITYTAQSIQQTGVLASYQFQNVSGVDALGYICKIAGPSYFFFVDEVGVLWFINANFTTAPTYQFTQGTQYSTRNLSTSIANLYNYITVVGASPPGAPSGTAPPTTTLSGALSAQDGPGPGAPTTQTALGTALLASTTGNITVTSTAAFSSAQSTYAINGELISMTVVDGQTMSIVQRGLSGTTATTHSTGAAIGLCNSPTSNCFVQVTADPGFVVQGYPYVQVDSEVIGLLPNGTPDSSVLTIAQRGAQGTTIAVHQAGAAVVLPPGSGPQPLYAVYDGTTLSPYPRRDLTPNPTFSQCSDQKTLTNMANTMGAILNRPVTTVELTAPLYGVRIRLGAVGGATAAYFEPTVMPLSETYQGAGMSLTYLIIDSEWDGTNQKLVLSDLPANANDLTYEINQQLFQSQAATNGAVTSSSTVVIQPNQVSGTGPTVPSGLAGTTGVDIVAQAYAAYVELRWNSPPATDHVAGWSVDYLKQGDTNVYHLVAGSTSIKVPNLIPGFTYLFSIRAFNNLGVYSAATPQIQVITAQDSIAPAQVTAVTARRSLRGAFVQWQGNLEPDLQGYEVQVSVNSAPYQMATTTPMLTTLYNYVAPAGTLPGAGLVFQVRAVDWGGNRGPWAVASAATTTDGPLFDELQTGNLINFGTITSGGFQTGAAGARWAADSTSMRCYDGSTTAYGAPSGPGVTIELGGNGQGFFAGTLAATSVLTGGLQSGSGFAVPVVPGNFSGFQLDPLNGLRFFSGGVLNAQFSSTGQITIYSGAGLNIIGGIIQGGQFQGIQFSPPAWVTGTNLPVQISTPAVAAGNGYLCVMGGYDATPSGLSTVYTAPIQGGGNIGAWTAQTSLPSAFYGGGTVPGSIRGCYSNGRVYVLSQFQGTGSYQIYSATMDNTGTIGAWRTENGPPVNASSGLLIAGGYAYSITPNLPYSAPVDPNTGAIGLWTPLTGPGMGDVVVTDGSYVYAIGGVDGRNRVRSATMSGGQFGPWVDVQLLILSLANPVAAVVSGYLYVMDGYTYVGGGITLGGRAFYAKIIGDGTLGPFVEIVPPPVPGMWAGVTTDGSYLYRAGGSGDAVHLPAAAGIAAVFGLAPPPPVLLPSGYTGIQMDPVNGLMLFDQSSLYGSFGPGGTLRSVCRVGSDLSSVNIAPVQGPDPNINWQNWHGIELVGGSTIGADLFQTVGSLTYRVCGGDWSTAGTYAWAWATSFPARYVWPPTGISLFTNSSYQVSDTGGGTPGVNSINPFGFNFYVSTPSAAGQCLRMWCATGGT